MIAEKLLTDSIVPVTTSESGERILSLMSDFHVKHFPVVEDNQLLGLISEDDILKSDLSKPIGSYNLLLNRTCVKITDHIYDVIRIMVEHKITAIPVINDDEHYAGLILQENLLRYFGSIGSFTEPGCIVVLEMSKLDYSLSEIARIIELENAVVLSSFITSKKDSERVDVTLKINRQNIGSIIPTFERFGYEVKASFEEAEYIDSLKENYDALMAYLNV